jgi:hypothetical protein
MLIQVDLTEDLVHRIITEKIDDGSSKDFAGFIEGELREYYSMPPVGWVDDDDEVPTTSEDSDSDSETDSEEEAPQLQETGT